MSKNIIRLIYALILLPISLVGQVLYPDTYLVDYQKVIDLKNSSQGKPIMVRNANLSSFENDSIDWNLWGDRFRHFQPAQKAIHILPVVASVNFNSTYPRGYKDGAVWKGKGANMDVNFGVKGNYGMLHFTFAPVIYYAQNLDYDRPVRGLNDSLYSYQFERGIDWVQLYGNSSITRFHLGQSDLRLIYKGFTLGVSTQNFTLGPAQINPIVMSTNGPMFPHVDLGTDTPIQTKLGDFEMKLFWGIMQESDYFDDDPDNDRRFFTGGHVAYRPSFLPGLSLGFIRTSYRDWEIQKFKVSDFFRSFAYFSPSQDTLGSRVFNDLYDQVNSINIKWAFEEVGFEAYLEFARNDFSKFRSLVTEPEHSRGFTAGFSKVFDLGEKKVLKTMYEHTTLGITRITELRGGVPTFYTHNLAPQGYTNKGQILGAGIGPGSNADNGSINYYYPNGMFGISVQRIRFNDDYSFKTFTKANRPFDVEWTYGAHFVRFLPNGFSLQGSFSLSDRFNWNYEQENDAVNVFGEVSVGYQIQQ